MIKSFVHSTVFKIAALMFLVSFMAIASMFSSVFISDGAQSDAHAINVAGSLRMQSYRIASHIHSGHRSAKHNEAIENFILEFEKDLTSGVLANQQALINSSELTELHERIKLDWEKTIKPMFYSFLRSQSSDLSTLNSNVSAFVANIDSFVMSYQQHAEKNIATIRAIQSIALFSTLIFIAFAMLIVNRHIEKPLSKLTAVAREIGRGDFTAKADESGKDELAVLARTMNKMSGAIYRSKSQLEEQVKRKTQKLSRSNASLDLLFEVSRKLNEAELSTSTFNPTLKKLAKVTGVKDLDLCIMTADGKGPYDHLITTDKTLPDKCIKLDCGDCTEHNDLFPGTSNQIKYQLTHGDTNYGVLVVNPDINNQLEDWQHQLFELVAEQVANGLRLKQQLEQGRRIALMNERTVIARELHDSLAQALSYLKIQVTRLQKLQQKDSPQEQIDSVIDELKNGLSSAYRELRELLTTFRLKLDGQSLKAAFEQTITQLKTRSDDFTFALDYQVSHIPFSPQEEIHLLQITREAMQNAFYHSKGDKIDIRINVDEFSSVTVFVEDNGIGMPSDPNKMNHYGLAIMQERSRNLGGDISFGKGLSGGTIVKFQFVPEYAKSINMHSESA